MQLRYPLLLLFAFVAGCSETTAPMIPSKMEPDASPAASRKVGEEVEVSVRLLDEAGNAAERVMVRWTAAAGSGSPSADSVATDSAGVSRVRWTLGTKPGEQTITAAALDLPPTTFKTDVKVGDTAFLQLSSDSIRLFAPGDTAQVFVIARDRFDNPIFDADITWVSSDPAVAKVEQYGVIRSAGRGVTMVRASSGTASDSVAIYSLPKGVFTITFDDGFASAYRVAFPLLREAGLEGNVAVNPTPIDLRWTGYLTLPELTELHNAGWSVVSHTMSHADMTTLSDAQLEHELAASRAWIEAKGFRGANIFVTPFHRWGDRERAAVRRHYSFARGSSATQFAPERYQSWPLADRYAITGLEPEVFTPSFTSASGRELLRQKLRAVIDRGDVVDVFFHDIAPARAEAFTETVKVLAEFQSQFRAYHEIAAN